MSAHLIPSRRLVACGALALTLVLTSAACSDDDEGRVVADVLDDDGLATQPASVDPTDTTEAAAQTCEPETPMEVTAEDEPEVTSEGGEDPTELGIEDLTEGEGHEVVNGDSVQLQYTGVLFSDGTEFDTSWDDLMPLPVTVGTGGVIEGFDAGIVGMRPGGRRQLTIPAEQAYGDQAQGEDIPANSALIFVIDLVQVCFPDPEAATSTTLAEGETTVPPAEGGETTVPPAEGDETTTTAVPAEGDDTTTTAPPAEGDDTTTSTTVAPPG